jgi:hypothetical protein
LRIHFCRRVRTYYPIHNFYKSYLDRTRFVFRKKLPGGQKTKSPQPKLQRGLPEEQPCGFLIGPQAGQDIGLPEFCGGRGGIRTHGPASGTPDFESGAFDQLSHPSTGEKTEVGKISQMAGLSMI